MGRRIGIDHIIFLLDDPGACAVKDIEKSVILFGKQFRMLIAVAGRIGKWTTGFDGLYDENRKLNSISLTHDPNSLRRFTPPVSRISIAALLPEEVISHLFSFPPAPVARGLRVVSREAKKTVYERTLETLGGGKWRAFMHADGTVLFQQLSYNKETKTLRIHSLMTNYRAPELYQRVTTWFDGGKSSSEAIGITLYSPDPPFEARGSLAQYFFRTKAMAKVGGGEGFAMLPSWNLPDEILSNGGGLYWTLGQHLRSPMFLRLFRRGMRSQKMELELTVTLDHHIPAHGADVTWAKVTRATRMDVWLTGMAYARPYTSIFWAIYVDFSAKWG